MYHSQWNDVQSRMLGQSIPRCAHAMPDARHGHRLNKDKDTRKFVDSAFIVSYVPAGALRHPSSTSHTLTTATLASQQSKDVSPSTPPCLSAPSHGSVSVMKLPITFTTGQPLLISSFQHSL